MLNGRFASHRRHTFLLRCRGSAVLLCGLDGRCRCPNWWLACWGWFETRFPCSLSRSVVVPFLSLSCCVLVQVRACVWLLVGEQWTGLLYSCESFSVNGTYNIWLYNLLDYISSLPWTKRGAPRALASARLRVRLIRGLSLSLSCTQTYMHMQSCDLFFRSFIHYRNGGIDTRELGVTPVGRAASHNWITKSPTPFSNATASYCLPEQQGEPLLPLSTHTESLLHVKVTVQAFIFNFHIVQVIEYHPFAHSDILFGVYLLSLDF
jgi:hypothetical protein